jgi:two-component system, OmpR family, response regulator
VIVMDRMMPKGDGLSVIRSLRAEGVSTPVLILSAMSEEEHRIEGLDAGSNDYLVKPFSTRELLARVRALWHGRDKAGPVTRLTVGDMEMDLLARTVTRAGQKIDLQPREFRLLEFLMRHAGEVVTRTMLLEKVWDYHFDPQTNVIDVHISRLRGKIDREFGRQLLHTVRGAGYRLEA